MPDKHAPLSDLRAFRRAEERRLAAIIMAFIVVVGGTAVTLVYGWQVALSGIACLALGAGLFGLLWLILSLAERWNK